MPTPTTEACRGSRLVRIIVSWLHVIGRHIQVHSGIKAQGWVRRRLMGLQRQKRKKGGQRPKRKKGGLSPKQLIAVISNHGRKERVVRDGKVVPGVLAGVLRGGQAADSDNPGTGVHEDCHHVEQALDLHLQTPLLFVSACCYECWNRTSGSVPEACLHRIWLGKEAPTGPHEA